MLLMLRAQLLMLLIIFQEIITFLGVGATKTEAEFTAGKGLSATPATALGATATEPLNEVFRLSTTNGENILTYPLMVSVVLSLFLLDFMLVQLLPKL